MLESWADIFAGGPILRSQPAGAPAESTPKCYTPLVVEHHPNVVASSPNYLAVIRCNVLPQVCSRRSQACGCLLFLLSALNVLGVPDREGGSVTTAPMSERWEYLHRSGEVLLTGPLSSFWDRPQHELPGFGRAPSHHQAHPCRLLASCCSMPGTSARGTERERERERPRRRQRQRQRARERESKRHRWMDRYVEFKETKIDRYYSTNRWIDKQVGR